MAGLVLLLFYIQGTAVAVVVQAVKQLVYVRAGRVGKPGQTVAFSVQTIRQ